LQSYCKSSKEQNKRFPFSFSKQEQRLMAPNLHANNCTRRPFYPFFDRDGR
jgi:hypothetical protein